MSDLSNGFANAGAHAGTVTVPRFGRSTARPALGLRGAVLRLVHALAADWRRRSGIRTLERLDDVMLDDIGLSRADVEEARLMTDSAAAMAMLGARRRARIRSVLHRRAV